MAVSLEVLYPTMIGSELGPDNVAVTSAFFLPALPSLSETSFTITCGTDSSSLIVTISLLRCSLVPLVGVE